MNINHLCINTYEKNLNFCATLAFCVCDCVFTDKDCQRSGLGWK